MAKIIPLSTRGDSLFFSISTVLDAEVFVFECKWNFRDESWYLSIFEEDNTPIVQGVRMVLGTYLGRKSTHKLFKSGVFVMVDTTGQSMEATQEDLGYRVKLIRFSVEEIIVGRGLTPL